MYDFEVVKEEEPDEAPEDGVYVYGLYLDGARFNRRKMTIDECYPKVLVDEMPYVSLFFHLTRGYKSCDFCGLLFPSWKELRKK